MRHKIRKFRSIPAYKSAYKNSLHPIFSEAREFYGEAGTVLIKKRKSLYWGGEGGLGII